ncbi:hypothetical protein [Lyngbya sp. CCY1209]|uniref:hypothetical protein n=1 Tax=Lyngbya sp. CCY1209 TaxID=2886103 RepID=UPI002D202D8E|nr:hypothetical protein [Lyngbya sp. CCY1209]MEB3886627.1 hypothetical protein [Lyngbya sp. CCY1209]
MLQDVIDDRMSDFGGGAIAVWANLAHPERCRGELGAIALNENLRFPYWELERILIG